MTRFPLRLQAKIRRAQFARMLGRRLSASALVLRVELLRPGNGAPDPEVKSEQELRHEAQQSAAPVIWLGGAEPLQHAACGKFTRELADGSRYVFVETDGRFLRRRIHEFRPVSRLYLTVRFADGGENWALALEGIRAAKLSGFLICAHLPVKADSELAELLGLIEKLRALDADGFVVTGEAPEKLEAVWSAIGDRKWMEFSREIADALRGEVQGERRILRTPRELEPEEESSEEGLRVS
jgi:hypothetical protein